MTITTLRPAGAETKRGQITYSSGSTIIPLVDDTPAVDTSYVSCANGSQWPETAFWLNLPDNSPLLTASQRIKAVRIRARVLLSAFDGGRAAYIGVDTRDDRDGTGTFNEKLGSTSTGAWQEKVGLWRTKPTRPSLSELNQGDFNHYQIYCNFYHTGGTVKSNLRVSELYLDVDVRTIGTVTSVVASELDVTTQPLISWSFNPNTDNDQQKAYRVRIFSAAQYGIVGFNPATSVSTWDSGVVRGNVESARVGLGGSGAQTLVNGQTYKAYVRAAQDFNGQDWWITSYVASAAFLVDVTQVPPSTPVLTVTPDTTVPFLRNFLTLQGMLNLMTEQDSSIELNIGNWLAGTSTTASRFTGGQSLHGAFSLSLVRNTSTGDATATNGVAPGYWRVKAGQQYTMIASFKAATAGRTCRVELTWFDRAGVAIGSDSVGTNVTDNTSGWTQAFVTATAPTNAVWVRGRLRVVSALATEQHWVDSISIHPGSALTWSIGGLLDITSGIIEYSWSTIGRVNLAHPQLYGAGDGPGQNADGFFTTGANSTVAYDLSDRFRGQGSIRWDVNDTTSKLYLGWPSGVLFEPSPVWVLVGVPGRQYTFSLYAKASQNFTSQLNLQALDSDGNTIGSPATSGQITITSTWQRFSATITMPAGAVYIRPHLDNSASVTERFVWVDAIQWELGSTPTALAQPGGRPTIWTPVRGADLDELVYGSIPGSQFLYHEDHEVPPGYTVVYRGWSSYLESTTDKRISSDYTQYVSTMMNPPGRGIYVLSDPLLPVSSMRIFVTSLTESIHEEAATFYPMRPTTHQKTGQRPVVISDYLGGRDGTLEVAVASDEDWDYLEQLLSQPSPLWLVLPDFEGRYIRVISRSWTHHGYQATPTPYAAPHWRRTLSLQYVTVDRPGRQTA